jgi:hypothetical protein
MCEDWEEWEIAVNTGMFHPHFESLLNSCIISIALIALTLSTYILSKFGDRERIEADWRWAKAIFWHVKVAA